MKREPIIQIKDLLEAERSFRRCKMIKTIIWIVVTALALAFVATWRQS